MNDDNNRKTIQINESFLLTSNNKTKKNKKPAKPKKEKPTAIIKPNQLKKDLVEKIKKHQQNEKIKNNPANNTNSDNNTKLFNTNFMDSLEYLDKLSNKKNIDKKKRRYKTIKNTNTHHKGGNTPNVSFKEEGPLVAVDLPLDFDNTTCEHPLIHLNDMFEPVIPTTTIQHARETILHNNNYIIPNQNTTIAKTITIPDSPSYSCLKGSVKPTYRQFHNKTLKLNTRNSQYDTVNNANTDYIPTRSSKLQQLKKSYKKFKQKSLKTIKRTYNIGKTSNNNISILIKNNKTRRNIKKEHGLLKQKPLLEIKKYLYDRNLLKIGSSAPNDVLRTLYEQSILAGDIHNTNNGVTLHNFIEK